MSNFARVPKAEYVRCEAMMTISKTGRRCRRPAVLGVDPVRCDRHHDIRERLKGAGVPRRSESSDSGGSVTYDEIFMTRFYTDVLKPTLAARMNAQLEGTTIMQQLGTDEELALTRDAASQAVALYANTVEANVADPDKVNLQTLLATSAVMRDALKDVVAMAKDTATLQEAKQKLNGAVAAVMTDVIQAITRAAWEVFEDDFKVGLFEKRIREHLEMRQFPMQPGDTGALGTSLTPDQDVSDMDASVPRLIEQS